MGLDDYGFPVATIANSILADLDDFGDSEKELEDAWLEWLHFYPFDAAVATRLTTLLEKKLSRLDPEDNGTKRQMLERKLQYVTQKKQRYRLQHFNL